MKYISLIIFCSLLSFSFAQKPELVFVKGGSFLMGSETEFEDSEGEQYVHKVTLDDFNIGKFPITVAQYKAYCKETNQNIPDEKSPYSVWEDHQPMVYVNYQDALLYCSWLSKKYGGTWRLPTEAEWEYAANGGQLSKNFIYSGSNNYNEVAWVIENTERTPRAVGLKKANELGIYDMSGNVWEWCYDWFDVDYYLNSPSHNPTGPETGKYRVIRGGSWYVEHINGNTSYRDALKPDVRSFDYGFRVVFVP